MTILAHYCSSCTFYTPVLSPALDFAQQYSCNHCGALSQDIRLQDYAKDAQQDELNSLFATSLNLASKPIDNPSESSPTSTNDSQSQGSSNSLYTSAQLVPSSEPITYISQHYHHSSHIAKPTVKPSANGHDHSDLQATLLAHSITPQHLSPAQLMLFRDATVDERLLLLEWWRTSPPSPTVASSLSAANRASSLMNTDIEETSMKEEERLARARWEARTANRGNASTAPRDSSVMDGHYGLSEPYMYAGYSAWEHGPLTGSPCDGSLQNPHAGTWSGRSLHTAGSEDIMMG